MQTSPHKYGDQARELQARPFRLICEVYSPEESKCIREALAEYDTHEDLRQSLKPKRARCYQVRLTAFEWAGRKAISPELEQQSTFPREIYLEFGPGNLLSIVWGPLGSVPDEDY